MSGRHRGGGARGISRSLIVMVVAIVLVVVAVFGWFRLRDRIDRQGADAAAACVEGDAVLNIAADPRIAPSLTTLADRWTSDVAPVIRDHCISVQVVPTDSAPAAAALGSGEWNTALGPEPALWVPLDSRSAENAATAVAGQARSLATSPVVLAVPDDLGRALTSSAVGWDDLPSLQRDPAAMRAVGLEAWGRLGLALPTGEHTDATTLTLEAVATAATGSGTGPLTVEQADSPASVTAVTELALGANALGPTAGPTTTDALAALGAQPDIAAPVHAVPVVEQQLYAALDDGELSGLSGYLPFGAAPVTDYPAAIVDAPWVDETLARAAAEFVDYVRKPEQTQVLVENGFRVGDEVPAPVGDIRLPRVDSTLVPAPRPVTEALLRTRLEPVPPSKITMVVDTSQSMSTPDGDGTRLTHTAEALGLLVRRSPDTSVLGMYVFSDTAPGYRIAVERDGLTASKRAALGSALGTVTLTDDEPVGATLTAAYRDAVDKYDPTRPNSVLAVIDSDDTDVVELLVTIDELSTPGRPVRIDLVVVGDDVTDLATLQTVADRTGGTLQTIPSTQDDVLVDIIRKLAS